MLLPFLDGLFTDFPIWASLLMHADWWLPTVERFNGWATSVGHGALPHTASAHTYLERVRLYGRNPGSSFCTILTGSHTTTITLLPNITCTAHEEGGGGREVNKRGRAICGTGARGVGMYTCHRRECASKQ